MNAGPHLARAPAVILFCGLPGAGKTTIARERERATGAMRFSTDEWMADLGLDHFDDVRDGVQARLDTLWRELVARGHSVILEDGTWTRRERDEIRRIARESGATTEMHYFDVPIDELWRRLEARNATVTHGVVPITRELLLDCVPRMEPPDAAELSLFDRSIVHR